MEQRQEMWKMEFILVKIYFNSHVYIYVCVCLYIYKVFHELFEDLSCLILSDTTISFGLNSVRHSLPNFYR